MIINITTGTPDSSVISFSTSCWLCIDYVISMRAMARGHVMALMQTDYSLGFFCTIAACLFAWSLPCCVSLIHMRANAQTLAPLHFGIEHSCAMLAEGMYLL